MPLKNELIELIHQVQDQVRDYFTFRFDFVGSSQGTFLLVIIVVMLDLTLM